MSREQLAREVTELVARVIKRPVEQLDPNADLFTELGIDSLLGVEIIASLDRKYGLDVPEKKLKDVHTLNDIVKLVEEFLGKSSGGL